jgi:hypothetical protein
MDLNASDVLFPHHSTQLEKGCMGLNIRTTSSIERSMIELSMVERAPLFWLSSGRPGVVLLAYYYLIYRII